MRNLKKIICLILTLFVMIPFVFPVANADAASTDGTVLYSQGFEKGSGTESIPFPESFPDGRNINNNYSGGTVSVSRVSGGTGHIGDASNKSIVFSNNQDWSGAYKEILPASVFAGLTDYTVSFDMIYHNKPGAGYGNSGWARMTSFAFPSETSGTAGNRVTLYDAKLYNSNTVIGTEGCAAVAQPYASNATYSTSGRVEFVVRAGSGANDATFSVYINGKLLSTRTNAYSGAPYGMILLVANAIIELDNIQVRNNANGKCVCYETFEEADDTAAFGNRVFSAGRQIEYSGGEMEINYHTGGTKRNYANTKDIGTIGDENNHLVTLVNRTNAWVGAYKEIIPASAFAGLTDYTISFQIRTTNPSHSLENLYGYPGTTGTQTKNTAVVADFAIMKDGTSKTANHVSFYNWKIYNTNTLVGSDGVTTYFEKANSYDGNGHIHGEMKFVVTAGSGENDATFAIYMNDVLVSTRSNAYSGAPYGMILTLNNYIMQLDDIKVHDDVKGVDTYFEDFEDHSFYTANANFTGGSGATASYDGHAVTLTAGSNTYVGMGNVYTAASFAKTADLQGKTSITVSYDLTYTGVGGYSCGAYFHLGNNDVATGDIKGIWVGFWTDSSGDYFRLYSSGTEIRSIKLDSGSVSGVKTRYTVAYDSVAKTFKMWARNDSLENTLLFDQTITSNAANLTTGDIMFGLSNRCTLTIDNLLVTEGTPAYRVSYVGAQTTAIDNNKYSIRLLGGFGLGRNGANLYSEIYAVGFHVQSGEESFEQDALHVYTGIYADGEPVTAASLGQSYLFGLVINDIPTGGNVTFTVTPYFRNRSDNTKWLGGPSYTVVVGVVGGVATVISQTISST